MDDTDQGTHKEVPVRAYQLRLAGKGLTVEREVAEDVALDIVAIVMGAGPTTSGARTRADGPATARRLATSGGGGRTRRGMSLREYLDEVEPKRNVDRILAIGSYLKEVRGTETFAPDTVKREFQSASEPVPGNYSRDWRWAINAGWIAPAADTPGEYYVTNKGDTAIADKFSDDVKKSTGVSKTRRKRARKKEDETA